MEKQIHLLTLSNRFFNRLAPRTPIEFSPGRPTKKFRNFCTTLTCNKRWTFLRHSFHANKYRNVETEHACVKSTTFRTHQTNQQRKRHLCCVRTEKFRNLCISILKIVHILFEEMKKLSNLSFFFYELLDYPIIRLI